MTTTGERIAAAIKIILDDDRRADRERIAELERDLSHMQLRVDLALSEDNEIHKQLDELNEKCAALVVERDAAKSFWFTVSLDKAPSMRIDPDMSDPQPGKLLVVRLSERDAQNIYATDDLADLVGFLVETPAVKQEQWVIRTSTSRFESRDEHRLSSAPDGARIFGTKEEAQEHIDANCQGWASFQYPLSVITLAEARAIEAKR